jgi:hypothetical protein
MKALGRAVVIGSIILAVPAAARGQAPPCTVAMLQGAWVFATGIGELGTQLPISPLAQGKHITAIGTMNIDRQGNVSGTFDNTIGDLGGNLDVTYTGTVTLDEECRGTLQFTTAQGASRTDSIVAILRGGQSEFWGMSRNHLVLWTYTARRIGPLPN